MAEGRGRYYVASSRKDPDSMHHDGDVGKYMANKNAKLIEQFEQTATQSLPASSLFKGVSIHVNGFTRPSHQVC